MRFSILYISFDSCYQYKTIPCVRFAVTRLSHVVACVVNSLETESNVDSIPFLLLL